MRYASIGTTGSKLGQIVKNDTTGIPMFVDICKNMVSNIETPKEHAKFRGLYKILNQFCITHSNAYMELNVGRVHFKMNHTITVVMEIMAHENRDNLDLGIEDITIFQKNIAFLFNLAASELFNAWYAKYKSITYPDTSLIESLVNTIVEDQSVLKPKLILNKEVYPVTIGGGTVDIEEGHWAIITTIGQYPGLFGQNPSLGPGHQSALFGNVIVPKYRTFRFVSFFSRSCGPEKTRFWALKGVITFEFGNDSVSALEMSITATDDEWRKVLDSAVRRSELLPEPLLSTPAFKILGSFAEH